MMIMTMVMMIMTMVMIIMTMVMMIMTMVMMISRPRPRRDQATMTMAPSGCARPEYSNQHKAHNETCFDIYSVQ